MATGRRRSSNGSQNSLPMYKTQNLGLAGDYINVEAPAMHDIKQDPEYASTRTSSNYHPPPYPPPGFNSIEEKLSIWERHGGKVKMVLGLALMIGVGVGLGVPIIKLRPGEDWTEEESPEQSQQQLDYHLYLWLFISWLNLIVWVLIAIMIPHIFKFMASFLNPGQAKYWHMLKMMRSGVVFVGGAIGCYVAFAILIMNNEDLIMNAKTEKGDTEVEKLLIKLLTKSTTVPSKMPWQRIANDLLTTLMLWAVCFFAEKMLITFIAIHYHYRAGGKRIEAQKKMRQALTTLYDASLELFESGHEQFAEEDKLVGRSFSQKLNFFKGKKTIYIVDKALEDPRSSAALAKRIWLSLVPEGRDVLTADDVVEVIKSHRRQEAEECFAAIDVNHNGDLTLNEMVLTVMEMGRSRRAIYQGMQDIDRALQTLNWILLIVLTGVMGFFILLRYVKSMKGLKDALGISLIGLSFGFGRGIFEFLSGSIFIFLKHAYDVGDRIEVYNVASTTRTSVVVERISILYTVFRRIDNGKELQMGNDRLAMKRIENVTRSGVNREEISIFVDFNTTFQDLETLKWELTRFVRAKENARDYQPNIEVRLNSIFEMNKLELVVSFTHKSNWANEELRAARSSKFKCALLSVIRNMPLAKPGGIGGNPALKEGFEKEKEDVAYNSFTLVPIATDLSTDERNAEHAATGAEINSWVGYGATGLRRRNDNFNAAGMLYG